MRTLTIAIVLLFLLSGESAATITVTQCDETTLASAVHQDRNVIIDCGAATVRVSRPIVLNQDVTITGKNQATLDAQDTTHIFSADGHNLHLKNLAFRRAKFSRTVLGFQNRFGGTVIGKAGQVTLDHVTISDSDSPITAQSVVATASRFERNDNTNIETGTLTLHDCIFANNLGPAFASNTDPANAVATIRASQFTDNQHPARWNGTLSLYNTYFFNNHNPLPRGAGGALIVAGKILIDQSVFNQNTAENGGAIAHFGGTLELRSTKFHANVAVTDGGAVFFGGAEDHPWNQEFGDTTIKVAYSSFHDNRAARGGALSLNVLPNPQRTPLLMVRSTAFSNNAAIRSGGALAAGNIKMQCERCIFTGNSASESGAALTLETYRPESFLANSLVTRNVSPGKSAVEATMLDIINSTVADNRAGGLRVLDPRPDALDTLSTYLRLHNSIISRNDALNCSARAPAMQLRDLGNNLQFPGDSCGARIAVADPLLDGLYIPAPTSVARSNGDLKRCLQTPVNGRDVYDEVRPQKEHCTIGAVESSMIRHAMQALRRTDQELSEPLKLLRQYLRGETQTPLGSNER